MRSRTMVVCLAISTAMGCSKVSIPKDVEVQMNEVIKAVVQLAAWNENADAVFGDIATLPDKQQRIACLRKFAEKALTIDLSSPDVKDPRWTAADVKRLCLERTIRQIQKSGGTVDDAWDVLISLLSWHRVQADKLYGDGKLPKGLSRLKSGGLLVLDFEANRKYKERWLAYDMVASDYTLILHMTEKRFQTNEIWIWQGKVDESRIPVLKKRLEKFLGRPIRTLEQCDKDWSAGKSQLRAWPR